MAFWEEDLVPQEARLVLRVRVYWVPFLVLALEFVALALVETRASESPALA